VCVCVCMCARVLLTWKTRHLLHEPVFLPMSSWKASDSYSYQERTRPLEKWTLPTVCQCNQAGRQSTGFQQTSRRPLLEPEDTRQPEKRLSEPARDPNRLLSNIDHAHVYGCKYARTQTCARPCATERGFCLNMQCLFVCAYAPFICMSFARAFACGGNGGRVHVC
jgi:hypothetical protein